MSDDDEPPRRKYGDAIAHEHEQAYLAPYIIDQLEGVPGEPVSPEDLENLAYGKRLAQEILYGKCTDTPYPEMLMFRGLISRSSPIIDILRKECDAILSPSDDSERLADVMIPRYLCPNDCFPVDVVRMTYQQEQSPKGI